MQIISLDNEHRLWSVIDLLPYATVQAITNFDWTNARYDQGNLNHRRQICIEGQVANFEKEIVDLLPVINQQLGSNFTQMFGPWWVDFPGFWCGLHTDGHLPNAMQIYWLAPGPEYGTGFYHYKLQTQLKHQFMSEPNTGYLMLNHPEPDGSQPLQWHAMLKPLWPGQIRLSSYHIME